MAVIKIDYSCAVDRNSPEGRRIIENASRIAFQIAANHAEREARRKSDSTCTPRRSGEGS